MKAIITFHSIDPSGSVLSFDPENFQKLIQSITDLNLPIYPLETILSSDISRGLALTFDDGMLSVFSHALPVIKDFNIPAHLFLTTGCIGGNNNWPTMPKDAPKFKMMNWDQIEACHAGNISIEAHTQTHPNMTKLNTEQLEEECETCDSVIEQRLGRKPAYFAYPYGYYNEKIREFARPRYRASVTTFLDTINKNQDLASIPRLDSYYLQSEWIHSKLDNPIGLAYLKSRSLIRSARGHQ